MRWGLETVIRVVRVFFRLSRRSVAAPATFLTRLVQADGNRSARLVTRFPSRS
jgi:hypothetical protein